MIKKLRLGWGKLRRAYLVYLRPRKVKKLLVLRQGRCRRCGVCCRLLFRCPALEEKNGAVICKIYNYRSRVCRLFPLDKRDMADRDLVEPMKKCGFWLE